MKRNTKTLMAVLGLALTIASCSSEITEETVTAPNTSTNKEQMTFTATQEGDDETTRTALNGTTNNVEWQSDDAVAIWDGKDINAFTVTPSTSDKTSASLSGSVTKGSTSFVAVYPYSVGKNCDYDYIVKMGENATVYDIDIPNFQTATEGTFDPEAGIMIASGTGNNLAFKNLCAYLKITTTQNFKYIAVSAKTGDGLYIAGRGATALANPDFGFSGIGQSQITLLPTSGSTYIEPGTYYIAIAPYPIYNLTVDCFINDLKYYEKCASGAFVAERSKVYSLGSTSGWAEKEKPQEGYSVSATKRVWFTTGNLYWNGTEKAYHIESSQIGSSRDASGNPDITNGDHVSYFYWTNYTDYSSVNLAYKPYTSTSKYSYSEQNTKDDFWCGEGHELSIDGKDKLYVLSNEEWRYLINSRANAANLYKYNVTVTDGTSSYKHCLIIAPDNYTKSLKDSYTLGEITDENLTCLPAVGCIYELNGKHMFYTDQKDFGCYWTSTPAENPAIVENAYDFYFTPTFIGTQYDESSSIEYRSYAHCIRLVWTITE